MELFAVFRAKFPHLPAEENFPFAAHTTIGCGGTAALAVSPETTEETAELLSFFEELAVPYCFLGAGANVLPADGAWQGVVVRFHRMKTLSLEGETLIVGAGVTGGELLRFTAAQGIGGFEPFVGIPMTVGGGVAMNAGICDRHFSDLVLSVTGVERGRIRTYSLPECRFAEKDSVFLRGIAITEVRLKAIRAEDVQEKTAFYRAKRAHLPKGRSMGCTFVNPAGISAGRLIDECGLKGLSIGRVRVSEQHANFFLNEGTSSQDVSDLIALVKEEVYRRTGILLREEIRRIP